MRTTLNLDDGLLAQAKLFAAKQQTSLTRLIEEGLTLRLRAAASSQCAAPVPALPVYAGQGGLQPGIVDSLSHRALLDAADATGPSR